MKVVYILTVFAALFSIGLTQSAMADVTTAAYTGWDAPGNDFDSFLSGNQANCSQICLERAGCSGAVFNVANGRCWLKTVANTYSRAADGVLILKILSGRDGIDYPGGDYRNFQATSWQNCSRSCYLDSQCRAFTFNKATMTCWLKNAVVDAAFATDGVAGKK